MKRIIINGATGLIGKALIDYLDKTEYSLTVLSRNTEKAKNIFPDCEVVKYTEPLLPEVFENYFAVINLAGASIGAKRWNKDFKKLLYSSRINTTKNIAYAISRTKRKPEVFMNASAAGYYGYKDKSPADESSQPGKDFLARLCVDWEDCIKEIENSGIRSIKLRTAMVLARNGEALERLAMPYKFFVGGKLGSGNQPFTFIHIIDMVRIIKFALENTSVDGAINCTAPEMITNAEFSKILGRILKRPAIFAVPAFMLKLIIGEFAETILNGRYIIPKKLQDNGFKFEFPDAESALKEIYG